MCEKRLVLNQARILNQRWGKFPWPSRGPIEFVGSGAAWRGPFMALLHCVRALSVTFVQRAARYTHRERPHKQERLSASSPSKHRRAYLWSSRASSINISASLAFNYTIIEGLGHCLRDHRTRTPLFSRDDEGKGGKERITWLVFWCWLRLVIEKQPPFRSIGSVNR